MGQESSQITPSQEADGARIKPDPEEGENKSLHDVSNWQGRTGKAATVKNKSVKGAEARKKKRKKRRSSSSLQATQQTAISTSSGRPGPAKLLDANTSRLKWTSETGQTGGADALPSDDYRYQKKKVLEDRKRRLLAVAAAAAGGGDGPHSDSETNVAAMSEFQDAERRDKEDFGGLELDASTNSGKKAKKQHHLERSGLVASRESTEGGLLSPEASHGPTVTTSSRGAKKSRSKSSLSLKFTAEDNTVDDLVGQNTTPDASCQTRDGQTASISHELQTQNIQGIKTQRKSNRGEKKSADRSGGKQVRYTEENPFADSSDEEMDESRPISHDIHFAPNSHGLHHDISPSANFDSHDEHVTNMHDDVSGRDNSSHDSEGTTPGSSPPPRGTSSLSAMMTPKSRKSRANIKPSRKSRVFLQNTTRRLEDAEVPDRSQSIEQDMNLIDPALREIGAVWTTQQRSSRIHRDTATPNAGAGRKRCLPVDEDFVDQSPPPSLKKRKRSKSSLKPKAAKSKFSESRSESAQQQSEDDTQTSSTVKKRRVASKSTGDIVPKAEMVMGRFSDEEMAIMADEAQKYREMHDMTAFEQNRIIQDKPGELSVMWDSMMEALPHRGRAAIVKNCRRKFHNFGVRGKWTKEEDDELREAYERFPKRWKLIGNAINRHHEDVRDRWRNYVICGDSLKKEYWTEDEENHLRMVVAECIEAVRELKAAQMAQNPGMGLDTRPDIELIDWQIVSEKFGHTRSRLQCLDKFNRLAKLEDSEGDAKDLRLLPYSWRVTNAKKFIKHKSTADFLELLLALRQSQAGREGKVPWTKLGDMDLRAKWSCMARKVAWKTLRASVRGNENMKFQEIVTFLINKLSGDGIEFSFPSSYPTGVDALSQERGDTKEDERIRSAMFRPGSGSNVGPAREGEVNQDQNIDPLLYQLGEDEFDPDDVEEQAYEKDATIVDDEDGGHGDLAMGDDYQDTQSVDLDASDQERVNSSHVTELQSPILFKAGLDQNPAEDFDDWTHSDEDDVDMDIPARRPDDSQRFESVDLG